MNRKVVFWLLFVWFGVLVSKAQPPDGYYDAAQGLTGQELLNALSDIITNGHTTNSYGDLYTYYEETDNFQNSGKVWDMYSMDGQGNAAYYYYYGQGDECGTYSGEGDCYNREHSVPASWFDDDYPMYADLFIVYPTDGYVNNRRSNYPYGEVDNPSWTSTNGSKVGTNTYPGGPSVTVFEPIDDYKGDFARTYFYVATRYKDDIPNWDFSTNLQYVFNSDGTLKDWAVQMFMQWHEQDPVSQKEIDRNNAVYNIQHNRNPFIDHPEWVECIWGNSCSILQFTSTPVTQATVGSSYLYQISATSDDTTTLSITCTQLPYWLNFQSNYHTTAKLYGTPVEAGSYDVSLKLSNGTDSVFQNFTIIVTNPGEDIFIIDEDFTDCPPQNWIIYSAASNEDWTCSSSGYIYVNNYGADVAADDWLITPPVNLDNYENEKLGFKTYTRYSDSNHPRLTILYSTNYDGASNPNDFTWNQLDCTLPPEDSQTWTYSGDIDISAIEGNAVYFAFHYTSSGTTAGNCELWELDSVRIWGDSTSTPPANNFQFTSTPVENAQVNQEYVYNITATADDTTVLTINCPTRPDWLNFQSNYHTTATLSGTPTQAGNYNVVLELTDGNSSVYQDFTITVSEPANISVNKNFNLKIYPNPAQDFINISLSGLEANFVKLKLFSPDGRLLKVYEYQNISGKNFEKQIKISDLSQKVLILSLETDSFVRSYKIIKK